MAALPRNCWDLQPSLSPWAQTPPLLSRGRSSGWGHGQLCPDLLPPGLLPCEGGRGTHPRIQMRGRQDDLRLGAAPTPAGSRSSEPASHPQTPCPTPQKLFYLRSPRAQAPSTGGSRQGRGHRRHRMTLIDTEVGWGTHTEDLKQPTSTGRVAHISANPGGTWIIAPAQESGQEVGLEP